MKITTLTAAIHLIDRVELHIRPSMRMAITLPLHINGRQDKGVSLYIAQSSFSLMSPIGEKTLIKIAEELAARINRNTFGTVLLQHCGTHAAYTDSCHACWELQYGNRPATEVEEE